MKHIGQPKYKSFQRTTLEFGTLQSAVHDVGNQHPVVGNKHHHHHGTVVTVFLRFQSPSCAEDHASYRPTPRMVN